MPPAYLVVDAVDRDGFIEEVIAATHYVRAELRSPKQLKISFDEWNVWYQSAYRSRLPRNREPAVTATARRDEQNERLALFLVNHDPDNGHTVEDDLCAFPDLVLREQLVLQDHDIRAANSAHLSARGRPRTEVIARLDAGRLAVELPPVSWTTLGLGSAVAR